MTKEKIYQAFGILIALGGIFHITELDVMAHITVWDVLLKFITGIGIFIFGTLIAVWNIPVDYFK